jgi:DNA-binding NarL/FixJ family response regulator
MKKMENKKTVLIVDDHPLFRAGIETIIARSSNFQVVGEAGNGRDGLLLAKKLRPDLVVMDISLPDRNGTDVTRDIRSLLAATRVIICSMHSKIDYVAEAFRAGATGYVVKESAADRLLQGLETVSKGEFYLDGSLSSEVIKGTIMVCPEKGSKIADEGYDSLTPREQQIMRLLAEGCSSKEIAEELNISPKTVENHRANIMNKLGLHGTVELVRYAARLGLIDVDLWKR